MFFFREQILKHHKEDPSACFTISSGVMKMFIVPIVNNKNPISLQPHLVWLVLLFESQNNECKFQETRMNQDAEIRNSIVYVMNYQSLSGLKRRPNVKNWLRFEN